MKLVFYIFISIILSLNCASGATSNKLYTDDEVEIVKNKITSKLESNLASYLGKIKFSIFLKLNTQNEIAKQSTTQISSLYLIDNQAIKNEESKKNIYITSATVKVVIYESLKTTLNKEIEEIVSATFDNVKVNIKISYLSSTRPLYDSTSNSLQSNIKTNPDDFFTLIKLNIIKHTAELIRLFGMLMIGVCGVLSLFVFGKILKTPLNNLADSAKAFGTKQSAVSKNNNTNSTNKEAKEYVNVPKSAIDKFNENVKLFKNILLDNPKGIAFLAIQSETNAAGIRKLLPHLYEKKYCDLIKDTFTDEHFKLMTTSKKVFDNDTAYYSWLEEIIESLSIDVFNKRKNILSGITEDQLKVIKNITFVQFKKYLDEFGCSTTYQIAMDLFEGEKKDEFLRSLGIDQWKIAFEVKDIDEQEISKEVSKIIHYSLSSKIDDEMVTASKIQTGLIVPSLLAVVSYKKLKMQDDFLDSLSAISSDTVKAIRESFWAPRDLYNVPESILKEKLRSYNIESKVMIIYSMPADVRDYLVAKILEGNAREIIKDNLNNLGNDFNEEKAELLGVQFIDMMFKQYSSGLFKLNITPKTVSLVSDLESDLKNEAA
jgi:hypothetical protein